MHKWLKDHGVEFRNKSFCSAVLTDKDGVVRGVEVLCRKLRRRRYLRPMHKWLKDHGVEFRNKSFCSAVLTDKDGVVRGVEVEGQYDFDKKTHKNTYKVQAVKGVVFATGSWGADNEFISASTPQYSTLESTSQKGATSESVRMLLGLGAMPVFATGSWGADNEFISASTPQYSTLESTSQKGATSESVRMLLGLGAMPVLLDIYQVGP